jgi:hypothetical protein
MSTKLPLRLSAFQRLKRRLARNKVLTDNPDRVSEIIADTAKKIDDSRDLRALQTKLLEEQLQYRADHPIRCQLARLKTLGHRARIRRPLSSAVIRDVFSDFDATRLYMSTSTGSLLRADKPHKNPILRRLISERLTSDAKGAGLDLKTELVPA